MLVQQIGPLQVGPLKMLVRQIEPRQIVSLENFPTLCSNCALTPPIDIYPPTLGEGDICLWGCAQCAGARFAVPSSSRGPIRNSTKRCGTQLAAKSERGPIYLEPPDTYVYPIVFKIIQIRISTRLILLFSNN